YITSFRKGFGPSILLVFTAFGLIMLQPDLGTGVVLVLTCMLMIFVAGANLSHFFGLAVLGIGGFVFLVLSSPYRMSRVTSFSNHSVIICDWAGWFNGNGAWTELTKIFLLTGTTNGFYFCDFGGRVRVYWWLDCHWIIFHIILAWD